MSQDKKLIILCGPSGSGKTTIASHLLDEFSQLTFSVSATTRPVRGHEVDGIDYHFLSVADFEQRIKDEQFVEFEEVYKDVFYGTLKSELEKIWLSSKIPVLDIDVIGALNIKTNYAPEAITIFIHPVTIENLRKRLLKRATETTESFEKRIAKAEHELKLADKFDKIVYNEDLDSSVLLTINYVKNYLQGIKEVSKT